MTNDDIAKALDAAATELRKSALYIWEHPSVDGFDVAEVAFMKAHNAYRKAIGAHCEDCGADGSWSTGLA